MQQPQPDFSRIDDAQLVLPTKTDQNISLCHARSFNVLMLTSNLQVVNSIIDHNIIDPGICRLLQEQCPSISLVECKSGGYKHADLPEGWKWRTQDANLQLIDGNDIVQFSWMYGLQKYNS
jgi:hypothetical protein